ncbi:MAG TPA: hypothetical protein O0X39_03300 [Methanocorpusculum sp.]|nr:hypothetical protein [Methanocorpusculum sp.]
MRIKTSAVFGSLNNPVDLHALEGLDTFRLQKNRYLKMGNATACIYKSGKVQIYGLKDLSAVQAAWEDFLKQISTRTDVSQADLSPFVKYITAEEQLSFIPQIPAQIVRKTGEGTIIVRKSGMVVLDGFDSLEKAERAFSEIQEELR